MATNGHAQSDNDLLATKEKVWRVLPHSSQSVVGRDSIETWFGEGKVSLGLNKKVAFYCNRRCLMAIEDLTWTVFCSSTLLCGRKVFYANEIIPGATVGVRSWPQHRMPSIDHSELNASYGKRIPKFNSSLQNHDKSRLWKMDCSNLKDTKRNQWQRNN